MNLRALAFFVLIFSSTAMAQTAQPYSGLQTRDVKALSEGQIADLRAGKGMSLALAAELNGYPGPSHVLELADSLQLTDDQRVRVATLFAEMKTEATSIGEKMIADETELNQLFASSTITADKLTEMTDRIGARQAALRRSHLRYHLITRDILSPVQIVRYSELRGYGNGEMNHNPSHRHSK